MTAILYSGRSLMYYRCDISASITFQCKFAVRERREHLRTACFLEELTLRLLPLAGGHKVVSTFLHGPQDVFVIRVQVMVKTKEVKLGVTGLLSFQDYLKLSPLLAHKVGCPLHDVMSLDGCWLQKK